MKKLIAKAAEARKQAYAPYSKFKVGAALEASDGRIFTGCNIENASHGVSCCAERTALNKAVSEGVRRFKRIAVVTGAKNPSTPCGICRQALSEFSPDIEIIMANTQGKAIISTLSDLLPNPFKL